MTYHENPFGGAELFHAGERTVMTKQIAAFRSYVHTSLKKTEVVPLDYPALDS
jgi:hypothetical protein